MERRKGRRYRVPFDVEVIPSTETDTYVPGDVKDFSPDGFSFDAKNIALDTNSAVSARFQIFQGSGYIHVRGRVVWKIQIGEDSQLGVEIGEIDAGSTQDLGFPFNMWKDKIK